MSTKPTFKVSGVLNEALKQMDPESIQPFDYPDWNMSGYTVEVLSNKKDALLIPDGPPLVGAYIDEDGYPRLFDPNVEIEEDEFLYMNKGLVQVCTRNHVYIVKEGESLDSVPNGMIAYDEPVKMKTSNLYMVERLVEEINGVMH